MSDIIEYNLSLLEIEKTKEETDISITPEPEAKNDIDISSEIENGQKEEQGIKVQADTTSKQEIDLSSYSIDDEKLRNDEGVETGILDSVFNNEQLENLPGALLGSLREFPLEPVNEEDVDLIIKEDGIKTELNSVQNPNGKFEEEQIIEKVSPAKDFRAITGIKRPDGRYLYREDTKNVNQATGKEIEPEQFSVLNVSPFINKKMAKLPYSEDGTNELNYNDILDRLRDKELTTNLGTLHVYPVNPSEEGGISSKYIIPFEFNPEISESGVSAKYEVASLLSRVGDIQSYIKTDNSTVSLNTNYVVLTDKNENIKVGDNAGVGNWMKDFHLRNIQSIETAYRGIVFPQSSKEAGSFFRPPLVKIVFNNKDGGKADTENPFSSLLTYPYKIGNETKVYHKSFIVSKIDIKKDWNNTPIILRDDLKGILDLQGFSVSLELVEIDPMYIGVLPTFEDYYSIVRQY